jgi:hypothetical protein
LPQLNPPVLFLQHDVLESRFYPGNGATRHHFRSFQAIRELVSVEYS